MDFIDMSIRIIYRRVAALLDSSPPDVMSIRSMQN